MSELLSMYDAQTNSPATYTSGALTESQESFVVDDASVLPEAPNLLVLGGDKAYAETVLLLSVDTANNTISVRRSIEGTPVAWPAGTMVARLLTAKEINDIGENIRILNRNKAEGADLETHASNNDIHVSHNEKEGWSRKYSKPSGGIPIEDLSSLVQNKLESDVMTFEGNSLSELPDATTILTIISDGIFPIIIAPRNDNNVKTQFIFSGYDEENLTLYFTNYSDDYVLWVLKLSDIWESYSIDLKAIPSHQHLVADITNFPSAMPPTAHSQSASTVTAGTFGGQVVANSEAQKNLGQAQLRNVTISTTDIGEGAALAVGSIYIVY